MLYNLRHPWRAVFWLIAFVGEYVFLLLAVSHDATIRPILGLLLAGIACTGFGMWLVHKPAVMLAGGRNQWLAHFLKAVMLFVACCLLLNGGVFFAGEHKVRAECHRVNPFIRIFEPCGDENYHGWRLFFGLVALGACLWYIYLTYSWAFPKQMMLFWGVVLVLGAILLFWPSSPQQSPPAVVTTSSAPSPTPRI